MTRVIAAFAAVVALAATFSGQSATAIPQSTQSLPASVDALFAQWNRPDSPGCGVGVSHNGLVTYERGYGMANLEHGVAITTASMFNIASISKQFTAMAVLILAQRGRLSLDDDVRRYVDELPDYGTRITLRHLLTHTSGLRVAGQLLRFAGRRDVDVTTNADVVDVLARQTATNFPPGAEYAYNNGGYTLLAIVVERVSGQSLRAFSDANIFRPLGMASAYVHDNPAAIVANRTSGYYIHALGDGTGLPGGRMSDAYRRDLNVAAESGGEPLGADGIYMTIGDLLRWEQNFAVVRVGDPTLIAEMQRPTVLTGGTTSDYGFGVVLGRYRGLRTVEHGGSNPGFDLHVTRYPDQGFAVAVLCNLENIDSMALSQRVADVYLADAFPVPPLRRTTPDVPVTLSADQLASRVGLYRNPLNDDLRQIFIRDGALRALRPAGIRAGRPGAALTPVSASRFVFGGGWLEFVAAAAGRSAVLRESVDEQRPIVFERVSAFTPSRDELQAFAGDYTNPELAITYTVIARDADLLLQLPRGTSYLLSPTFTDAFQEGGPPFTRSVGLMYEFGLKARFSRDARGAITGFWANTSGIRNLRFDRVQR